MVLVSHRAHVAWRPVWKRVGREQAQCLGRAFEYSPQQHYEPRVVTVGAQRCKPHLPIEPRLVGLHPSGCVCRIARLVTKLVNQPLVAVGRSFDCDLEALLGHMLKQSVPADNVHCRDGEQQRLARSRKFVAPSLRSTIDAGPYDQYRQESNACAL